MDVFFYILEGEGQVEIGDEVQTVNKDTIIDSPVQIPHRLINPGKDDFHFLVIKIPRPIRENDLGEGIIGTGSMKSKKAAVIRALLYFEELVSKDSVGSHGSRSYGTTITCDSP
jgi:hypothetical protein